MEYKLTIFPALELGDAWTTFRFETQKELEAASNTAAGLLLFMQDQAKIMDDYSNMFVCEKFVDGEWEELDL